MEKKETRYVVVRETSGKDGRVYHRYYEFDGVNNECEARSFANRTKLAPNKSVVIYLVKGELEKKSDVFAIGTRIFEESYSGVIYDRDAEMLAEREKKIQEALNGEQEAEALVEPEREEEAEPEVKEKQTASFVCKPTFYVVLKVASNRKRTKFHSKLKVFHSEGMAISYARSRIRGGCVNARVFLLDPQQTNHLPYEFANGDANTDAIRVMVMLGKFERFYCDRNTERDLRKEAAAG